MWLYYLPSNSEIHPTESWNLKLILRNCLLKIDHKSCTNPLENLPLAHIKRRCLCLPVLTVFHLFQDEGHAADGEVGGGDGPQTCHSGVSGWDWEDTFTLVHSNTQEGAENTPQKALCSPEMKTFLHHFLCFIYVRSDTQQPRPYTSSFALFTQPCIVCSPTTIFIPLSHWCLSPFVRGD